MTISLLPTVVDTETEAKHGTRACYQQGCRLPECSLANADYIAKWRVKRTLRTDEQFAAAWDRLRPENKKDCRQCHRALHKGSFIIDRREADGMSAMCKACQTKQAKNFRVAAHLAPKDAGGRPLCEWCGTKRATTADHVVPLSHGGADDASNIVVACMGCNMAKGAKDPWLWAVESGRTMPTRFAPVAQYEFAA